MTRPGPPGGVELAVTARRDQRSGELWPESVHRGHLVVVGADGGELAALGSPAVVVFVRSAAKPFQATACLELLEPTSRPAGPELAVAWASHRGEPRHLEAVRALLARSGTPAEALTCPPALRAADPTTGRARIHHNCSGKHAMFALAGQAVACRRAELTAPDGRLQGRVLDVLAEALGPASAVAVDGCGAPAVAVPLMALARGYLRLATRGRWRAVVEAGLAHPGLVGGDGRLDTELLRAGVVAKSGAEGILAASWRDRAGRPRAAAVKAADGAHRAAAVALWELLVALEVVPRETWRPPPPLGGGEPAGTLASTDAVRRAAARLK